MNLDFEKEPLSAMRGKFVILWADHNFRLFQLLMNHLEEKRFAYPLIEPVFGVPLERENTIDSNKLDEFSDRLKLEKIKV